MMRSPAFPPRRPSHLVRYIVPAVVLICLLYYLSNTGPEAPTTYLPGGSTSSHDGQQLSYTPGQHRKPPTEAGPAKESTAEKEDEKPIEYDSDKDVAAPTTPQGAAPASSVHPIDTLIKAAEDGFKEMLDKESHTLEEAAAAYRTRRGRHPPPGFKEWYAFAKEKNVVMVEDFWDQIYHDLSPFWGMDSQIIRKESWDFEMTINIRNGNASAGSDWFWTKIWLNMIKTVEEHLPDMDIALNAMDEPRLVVPWEDINDYMEKEKKARRLVPAGEVITEFDTLPSVKEGYKTPATRKKNWEDTGEYHWSWLGSTFS